MDRVLNKQDPPVILPEVRQELSIYPAEFDEDGMPQWHLYDPLANKYYRLNEEDVQLLKFFGNKTATQISELANATLKAKISVEDVEEFSGFLRQNNLVKSDQIQLNSYQAEFDRGNQKKGLWVLIRQVLFLRHPLCNPDKFLDATLPSLRCLVSKTSLTIFFFITLLGIYLFSRQVDEFFSTFLYFFNLSGLVVYILALAFVKILHELGHAYVAKAYGCRVPTIGVALILGWPILYTDTSDAWKIANRKQRMAIGVAGVVVELAIASLSLFFWSITPEGSINSAFFLLATTTWILSILVNFNPLMRFDGYYLLSDWLRVPNLEGRSFSMAKWWLRERLFGVGISAPEHFRPVLIIYAYCVWIYRYFLFLGIALIIYNFFFKAAGMVLFVLAMINFLVIPVFKEIKVWWEMRNLIVLNRSLFRSLIVFLILLGLIFMPWQTSVPASAVLQGQISDLYVPESGRLVAMQSLTTERVGEEDVLFELNSPSLDRDIEQATHRYTELRWTQSALGFDSVLRSRARVVNSELATQNQILRDLFRQNENLEIKAPFAGELVDVAPDLSLGDWIPRGMRIATIVDSENIEILAYLEEEELVRVELGMTAKFYPENIEFGVQDAFVKTIDMVGITEMDNLYLASMFGGDVAVRENDPGVLSLVKSHYKIELELLDQDFTSDQVVRGTVVIDGDAMSFFNYVKRRFVSVFIRETGF